MFRGSFQKSVGDDSLSLSPRTELGNRVGRLPLETTMIKTSTRRRLRSRRMFNEDEYMMKPGVDSFNKYPLPVDHNDIDSGNISSGDATLASRVLPFITFLGIGVLFLIWKIRADNRKAEKRNLKLMASRWDEISIIFQENQTRMVSILSRITLACPCFFGEESSVSCLNVMPSDKLCSCRWGGAAFSRSLSPAIL